MHTALVEQDSERVVNAVLAEIKRSGQGQAEEILAQVLKSAVTRITQDGSVKTMSDNAYKQMAGEILSLFLKGTAIKDVAALATLVQQSRFSERLSTGAYKEILQGMADTEALVREHFVLLCGLHSEYFFRFSRLGAVPRFRTMICSELARRFADSEATVVMAPVSAGGLLVDPLAQALDARPAFFDLNSESRPSALRSASEIGPKDRVVLVNDMTTTTTGLRRMIQIVQHYQSNVVGIGLFATRGQMALDKLIELRHMTFASIEALVHLDTEAVDEEHCKQCAENHVPPYKSQDLND